MVRGLLRLACFLLIAASPSFYVQAYLPPIGAKEFPRYSLQAHERDAPDELKPGRIPLFTRFKQSLVGLSFLVASSVPIFGSPSNVHAKKSAAAGTLVAKPSSKKDGKGKGGMVNAKATKKSKSSSVKVEVVVEDDQNAKLTKVGLALVAAAALYTILAPADSSSTSSSSKKSKSSSSVKPRLSSSSAPPRRPLEDFAAPKDDEEEDIFGDEDDNTANAIKKDVEPKSRRSFSSFKSPIPLPPPEDLFDSSDEFFSLPESRLESSVSSAAPQPASKALKPEPKAEVTTPTPAPVAKAPEKKGILDRIFGKAGGGRPTSVVDALAGASGEELEFRRKCVQALLRFAPPGSVADNLKLEIGPFSPEDDAAAIISAAREKAGLAPEAAAEGFAALASAMMVAIVDNVVALVEDKKASKEDREAAVVAALDETSTFIRATGELFGILFAGISVEPVVYNGRSKKGRLEDAYYIYAKTSMNVADILQQATSKSEDGAASENDIRMQNLGRVQMVFGIKESKRTALEQRALKDMMMSMVSGGGGGADLQGMMKALSGKGGEGMDPKAFEKMVGDLGGMEGMPDGMADASPEEMARMTSEALASVKQSLEEGSITREEVKELESIMGMDIKQLVALMDQGKVDKARLKREMGSEFGDVLELFRALAKIK